MKIHFQLDDGAVRQALREFPEQSRFAIALTLTRVAKLGQAAAKQEMAKVFDRPTPYTLRSLAIRPATKVNLESEVFFREFAAKGTPATKYMLPQVDGGPRRVKRFERSLRLGRALADGMMAYPGKGARMDTYGNMSRGQITKILSYLRVSSDPTQNRGDGEGKGVLRKEHYFVGGISRSRHLAPGIYLRKGRTVLPVMAYGREATYRPRFAFHAVLERTFGAVFEAEFTKAVVEAIATKR